MSSPGSQRVVPVHHVHAPPRLHTLPDELIIHIFNYYSKLFDQSPARIADFAAKFYPLTLVCRRLNPIATAFMYSTYVDDPQCLEPFNLNPDFWKHVERAIFTSAGSKRFLMRKQARFPINPVIDKFDIPWPKWLPDAMDDGKRGVDRIEIAAILCQIPKVQEIDIEYNTSGEEEEDLETDPVIVSLDPILYAARGEPFGQVHKFDKLRSLRLDMKSLWFGDIAGIFLLPSLQNLTLDNLDYSHTRITQHEEALWDCPFGISNIQNLELWRSTLPSSIIIPAIKSCRSLTQFSHSHEDDAPRSFYFDIIRTLLDHRDTLRTLKLHDWTGSFTAEGELDPLWELRQFSNLISIDVPFCFVLGYGANNEDGSDGALPWLFKVLPVSLRSLYLQFFSDAPPLRDATATFARIVSPEDNDNEESSQLPNLREVTITHNIFRYFSFPHFRNPNLPMDFLALDSLFSTSRISFSYTLEHHFLSQEDHVAEAKQEIMKLEGGKELLKHAKDSMDDRFSNLFPWQSDESGEDDQ